MLRTLLPLILSLHVLSSAPVAATTFDEATFNCRIERLEQALAACLGYVADRRLADIDRAILTATSGLQAATGPEIRAFEDGLAISQATWLEEMIAGCAAASADIVEFEACRVDQTLIRQQIVEDTLAQALADLGVAPAYRIPVPDEVEVLVPLIPPTAAGPDAEIRLPLAVPIRP